MSFIQHIIQAPSPTFRRRIALFGGSFDPPHQGHFHVAKTALRQLNLDAVWWIPAFGNPLKSTKTSYAERLCATRQLIKAEPKMHVSAIEQAGEFRFSYDLVTFLQRHHSRAEFIWLMGSDTLQHFHKWHRWQDFAKSIPMAVISRPHAGLRHAAFKGLVKSHSKISTSTRRKGLAVTTHKRPVMCLINAPLNRLSSTAIRKGQ